LERRHQSDETSLVIRRLLSWLRRPDASSGAATLPSPATLAEDCSAAGMTSDAFHAARRRAPRLYGPDDEQLRALAARCADQARATIAAADRVLAHEFELLGSGAFHPVDPGRPAVGGYRPIDWYLDPVRALRFPERVPYRDWNLLQMRPGLADVKLPWEVARCHHWIPLAQAFRLTGDERYAIEIVRQHDDFAEANPVGFGIHWTCTMDVAIRALNWAIAADAIRGSASVDPATFARIGESLFAHGVFIEANLENKYEVTSNHFLSNVVGLYALGVSLRDLPAADRWRQSCREWLEREITVQVLDDGADYESSVPYHRLVTELFLAGWRLSLLDDRPLSEAYVERLRRMVAFLYAVLRPDGLLPQIGDADDGRVHIFSEYGRWNPQSARHLFGPAGALLGDATWFAVGGDWAEWETAWWGATAPGVEARSAPQQICRLFEHAGIAVARDAETFMLITNGVVGTNGFGNHKHNDLLSFEIHDRGTALIVDPGSYVYTGDPEGRQRFRGTAIHNTLTIDGVEQNEIRPEWLFRAFESAHPVHLAFDTHDDGVDYRGRHTGYARLPQGVVHERRFHLSRAPFALLVHDHLDGAGRHELCWHFHCAPGIAVEQTGRSIFVLRGDGGVWTLASANNVSGTATDTWYSPSYGVRMPCRAIEFTSSADVSSEPDWSFTLLRGTEAHG
jgi:uncharacterized heparinase superfamily protein